MPSSANSTPRFAYKADRLKPLRAFCQTARLGSVSRAAEALYVSQPAITLQLQALERELGQKLFERSGRRLVPTRAGEALYELARPLVDGIDTLPTAFRDALRGLDAGELNIAANSSTILYLLPRIVERFRQHHPDVRLSLHNTVSADGTDLLRSDSVDLVVGSMHDVPGDLVYEPVNACIRLTASVDLCHVVTVEHLAQGGTLHPVQQAMVDCHGSQCGFCTPGIVMSLAGLRLRNPDPTEAEIETALQGNLCRCTGYQHIVNAVRAAA